MSKPAFLDLVSSADKLFNVGGLAALGIPLNISPELLSEFAKSKSELIVAMYSNDMTHKGVCRFVEGLGVDLPKYGSKDDTRPVELRLKCADWWLKTLHKMIARERENIARDFGKVNKANEVYISKDSMRRIQARWDRSEQIMQDLVAYCASVDGGEGETVDMSEVLKGSMSNPKNRFAELMVRIRGFEDYAKEHAHKALFFTLTTPSRFHAYSPSGHKNKNYVETVTARDGQQYLVKVWSQVRAKLERMGVSRYGFRVVEPHHDGTPHWHMLLFVPADQCRMVVSTMSVYFKRENRGELYNSLGMPFRKKHKARFDVKYIDLCSGSAVGYIVKYIAKNIGCMDSGADFETGEDASKSAPLVRGWASLFGIRQFQQIGGSSVGVWRELRRLRENNDEWEPHISCLWVAANESKWAVFCSLLGGCEAKRKDQPVRLMKTNYWCESVNEDTGEVGDFEFKKTRYGELFQNVIGVEFFDGFDFVGVVTKLKEWVIGRADEVLKISSPWTRVNNCTVRV